MYLVQFDGNGQVSSCISLNDPISLPYFEPLNSSYMLSTVSAEIGQVFNAETQTFAAHGRKRWITKLAFDNRFAIQEAVMLKALQVFPARGAEESNQDYITRTQVPAQLQVLSSRLNMASYIDLDRTDTVAGVQALEAMGLLAVGRAAEILEGPIAEHEYHAGA